MDREVDGRMRLCELQQQDIRYLVVPRNTNIRSWLLTYHLNRLSSLYEKAVKNSKTWDEEDPVAEKVAEELHKLGESASETRREPVRYT
ncbi:hypothetical protein IL306_008491 [Fusarium sp. DS 682]|nr:hypothetical protein IL306_008491 [Fusarium sp. DS 682]